MTVEIAKLIVKDLERSKTFYEDVCEIKEQRRFSFTGDRALTQILLSSEERSGADIMLVCYKSLETPPAGSSMLVIETNDVHAFVDRAVRLGGSVVIPAKTLPELGGITAAIVSDPDGHLLEPLCRPKIPASDQ